MISWKLQSFICLFFPNMFCRIHYVCFFFIFFMSYDSQNDERGKWTPHSETLPVECPCCGGRKSSFPKSIFIPVSSQVEGKWKGQKKNLQGVHIYLFIYLVCKDNLWTKKCEPCDELLRIPSDPESLWSWSWRDLLSPQVQNVPGTSRPPGASSRPRASPKSTPTTWTAPSWSMPPRCRRSWWSSTASTWSPTSRRRRAPSAATTT